MNARMRLLFFTNGLLRWVGFRMREHGSDILDFAAWRLHTLQRMRKDGRT